MHRGIWLACLLLTYTSLAEAAELQWNAPQDCPDANTLEQETEKALGEPLSQYRLTAAATISKTGDQYALTLRITLPSHAETSERELQATTCRELLEAAAVAIALAAANSGEQTPAAVPQTKDLSEPPPRAAVQPVHGSQLAISTSGTTSWGALPTVGLGAELQLAWLYRWLRVGLGATWFPPRTMQLGEDIQASFGLYLAELLVCGQLELARSHLFACATAGMGRVSAHLDQAQSLRAPSSTDWRQLGIRFGGSYPILAPLELTASLALLAPLTRPRFYTDTTERHEPLPVTTQVLLGLLFSL